MISAAALPRRLRCVGSSTGVGTSSSATNFPRVTSGSSVAMVGPATVSATAVTFCTLSGSVFTAVSSAITNEESVVSTSTMCSTGGGDSSALGVSATSSANGFPVTFCFPAALRNRCLATRLAVRALFWATGLLWRLKLRKESFPSVSRSQPACSSASAKPLRPTSLSRNSLVTPKSLGLMRFISAHDHKRTSFPTTVSSSSRNCVARLQISGLSGVQVSILIQGRLMPVHQKRRASSQGNLVNVTLAYCE